MSKMLDEFQNETGAWGDATFPRRNIHTIMSHLREEIAELSDDVAAGRGLDEAADCLILLCQLAHVDGCSLFQLAEAKMAINRKRTWNTTPEPGGHIKHVEETA